MNNTQRKQQLKTVTTTNLISEKTLSHKNTISAYIGPSSNNVSNPWSADDVDKMEEKEDKSFKDTIKTCRFFYKHDSIASVVINKIVDISVNEIIFNKNGLTENEYKIFLGLKDTFKQFAEEMALEFMISGLVIPEIKYTLVGKEELRDYDIQRYNSLYLPTSLWLRDPATVEIKSSFLGPEPSYFVNIPKELVEFIQSKGKYSPEQTDRDLYIKLLSLYPGFVRAIENGETKILLENDLIFRRRVLTGNSYPVPFLLSGIENLKHKRNLRRMDYSIAARVISAIQLIRLGSDTFPVTEEDGDVFSDIKNQMFWRDTGGRDIERIFQLFANHTLQIDWVFPPVDALLDDKKYIEVNRDILLSLGISKTLLIGESDRSNTSDPELSTVSAVKTMENLRSKIVTVLKAVCREIAVRNNLKASPVVRFKPLNLAQFEQFANAMASAYETGNISRHSYVDYLGYDWADEVDLIEKENKVMEDKKVGQFAPQAFSPTPTVPGVETPTTPKTVKKDTNTDNTSK